MTENGKQKGKEKIMNVPNILTMFRMLLIPVFLWFYFAFGPDSGDGFIFLYRIPALMIFLIASLTDVLDGRIARKYDLITSFGKLADPLADKLMVICMMLCHAIVIRDILYIIPLILIVLKEGGMLLGGLIMLKKKIVVYSKPIGKAAQVLIVTALVTGFFHPYFTRIGIPAHYILIWAAVALSYAAGVYYMKNALLTLRFRP